MEGVGDGLRRGLEAAIAIDEAEVPVVDRAAAPPPVIRPRIRNRTTRALLEGGADVHRRDRRLSVLAFANAVGAGFGEQQRFVAGDVLQAREVGAQLVFSVEIHVEGADIEE